MLVWICLFECRCGGCVVINSISKVMHSYLGENIKAIFGFVMGGLDNDVYAELSPVYLRR